MRSVSAITRTISDPAFCFMLVVWGERYRRYFTDYCLPSLLAPNNIPSLVNRHDSRFAIATTLQDWAELEKHEVFKSLKTYIEPVLCELPPFGEADNKMRVMSSGHRMLSNYAFERRAFGVNVNPDSIYADMTVSNLQEGARNGVKVTLYPGVRFEFEGVVAELKELGFLSNPTVITLPQRTAAGIGIRNLHPFTIACNWDAEYFFDFPVYHYLLGRRSDVLVLHTISLGPLMLDYGSIEKHDDRIFDQWTLDGDYAHINFGHLKIGREVEFVDDSDRIMVLGFTPKDEDNVRKRPIGRLLRTFNKGIRLWRVYNDPIVDPLKKRLYLRQVLFHQNELGDEWRQLARRDKLIMLIYVLNGKPESLPAGNDLWTSELSSSAMRIIFWRAYGRLFRLYVAIYPTLMVIHLYWRLIPSYLMVIIRACLFDKREITRIYRRLIFINSRIREKFLGTGH
jgi:hypothetical protein